MTSTSVETTSNLAWSIPVCPSELGAHLEAYKTLRPIFDTLRLANRFGQGPKATVTKLPIELIEHIESYLIQGERTSRRKKWNEKYDCWRGKCYIVDHVDDVSLLEIYNDDCEEYGREEEDEVGEHVKSFCGDYLASDLDSQFVWREIHGWRVEQWFEDTEGLTDGVPGNLLMEVFGLEAWVGHTDVSYNKTYEGRQGKSQAFLCLPGWSGGDEFELREQDHNRAWPEVVLDTKNASAVVPYRIGIPTKRELNLFERAVKTLGLSVKLTLLAKEGDGRDNADEKEDGHKADVVRPKLRLLTRTEAREEHNW